MHALHSLNYMTISLLSYHFTQSSLIVMPKRYPFMAIQKSKVTEIGWFSPSLRQNWRHFYMIFICSKRGHSRLRDCIFWKGDGIRLYECQKSSISQCPASWKINSLPTQFTTLQKSILSERLSLFTCIDSVCDYKKNFANVKILNSISWKVADLQMTKSFMDKTVK